MEEDAPSSQVRKRSQEGSNLAPEGEIPHKDKWLIIFKISLSKILF